MIYTPTPDYYNDYLCHYGVKGMKWRKRLAGSYYRGRSKALGLITKVRQKINGRYGLMTNGYGKRAHNGTLTRNGVRISNPPGRKSSQTGRIGSKNADEYNRLTRNSRRNLSERGYDMSKHGTISGYAGRQTAINSKGVHSVNRGGANRAYIYNASNVEAGIKAGRERAKKKKKK